jgi:uncharacterized protein YecT (DUF1311 family)
MVRNKVNEIIDVRTRAGGGYRHYGYEIHGLTSDWAEGTGRLAGAPQFIPIRLVTIIEVFTRTWLAEIIDSGEPYIGRAAELVKGELKIDFAVAQALVGKQVTFGELVAHTVGVSSIADLERVFGSLLDSKLFRFLDGTIDRWDTEVLGEPAEPIIKDIDASKAKIARLFEVRHVLVHELPADPNFAQDELSGLLTAADEFVRAADQAFNTLINGHYPLTQVDMNFAAAASADKVEAEMNDVVQKLLDDGWGDDLLEAQKAWAVFCTEHSAMMSGMNSEMPGSGASAIYSSEREELTLQRTRQLREILDRSL